MRVGENFDKPMSSFLIVEKDFQKVFERMMSNPRLMKLLYYREADALDRPNLTQEQKLGLIGHELQIVPTLEIWKECPIFVIVFFDDFSPNNTNPQFRDCILGFEILCHPDHWNLGDFQLRPYKIAGEIDASFNNTKMTGIGELHFVSADNLTLNNQLQGLRLLYTSTQSTEDRIPIK